MREGKKRISPEHHSPYVPPLGTMVSSHVLYFPFLTAPFPTASTCLPPEIAQSGIQNAYNFGVLFPPPTFTEIKVKNNEATPEASNFHGKFPLFWLGLPHKMPHTKADLAACVRRGWDAGDGRINPRFSSQRKSLAKQNTKPPLSGYCREQKTKQRPRKITAHLLHWQYLIFGKYILQNSFLSLFSIISQGLKKRKKPKTVLQA